MRLLVVGSVLWAAAVGAAPESASVAASTTSDTGSAAGPLDGDRFSVSPGCFWKGAAERSSWWWQATFAQPRTIAAILQVVSDHDFVLRNAPRHYVWQGSQDGVTWQNWPETVVTEERRLFRLHRLRRGRTVRAVRIQIHAAIGEAPALREVEFFHERQARVSFPDWILAVNTTHDAKLPGHGQEFIPLARSCPGWERTPAQQVWLESFDPAFVDVEPRPLCVFLSGNFKDWCEVDRRSWRGTEKVLSRKGVALWASCGGAQGLALLSEYGTGRAWDCPHCRDPLRPKTPLYTHIGHTATRPCGDYSGCLFERGPHWIQQVGGDPVFRGLPSEMQLMESHCGQIDWVPKGWELVATAGQGTRTKVQCLRRTGQLIYAAQFHIEMAGTLETSRRIMQNFLELARRPRKTGQPRKE